MTFRQDLGRRFDFLIACGRKPLLCNTCDPEWHRVTLLHTDQHPTRLSRFSRSRIFNRNCAIDTSAPQRRRSISPRITQITRICAENVDLIELRPSIATKSQFAIIRLNGLSASSAFFSGSNALSGFNAYGFNVRWASSFYRTGLLADRGGGQNEKKRPPFQAASKGC